MAKKIELIVKFEDGREKNIILKSDAHVVDASVYLCEDTSPWDYEDPDGDGVFNG